MKQNYSRENPFYAKITERKPLCTVDSGKEIYHLVVDLQGSGISYEVGDCLAILPSNHPVKVDQLLKVLGLNVKDHLLDPRSGVEVEAGELLGKRLNINDCPLSLVKKLAESQKEDNLQNLLNDKQKVKELDLVHFLERYGTGQLSVQEIVNSLRPMMPRFYSIASSMDTVGDEVHLTVALGKCFIDGVKRHGVCTDYLCHQVPLHQQELPVYLHPHRGFTLPGNHTAPIIMVGPGTGIAPFRGFMQQREKVAAHPKHWLFFGDWTKENHYYYGDYWENLASKGMLRLDLAFSRDQAEKIYVQHRMHENGKELFAWLQEGAYFYVCGNASKMAKDVDQALHQVLEEHGNLSSEDAKAYVKQMRSDKRYLRDVY